MLQAPPRLPKELRPPRQFRAKHAALDHVPFAPKANLWFIAAKNRWPIVRHWLFVISVPALFGYVLIKLGPNIFETPSVVAGKLATINIVQTLFVMFIVVIIIVKSLRRPVPRGAQF